MATRDSGVIATSRRTPLGEECPLGYCLVVSINWRAASDAVLCRATVYRTRPIRGPEDLADIEHFLQAQVLGEPVAGCTILSWQRYEEE